MITESEMQDICYEYISTCEEIAEVKREIPFLSRSIDLVCMTKDQQVISIELKVHDWKHAIQQASDHRLGADKAYICLPKRKITDALSDALSEAGIGLLLFDPDAEKILYEEISPSVKTKKANHEQRSAPGPVYPIPLLRKILIQAFKRIKTS